METIRKPFQGVKNIVRFNWPFYAISIFLFLSTFITSNFLNSDYQLIIKLILGLIIFSFLISLLVSWYIYDLSKLYEFSFLNEFKEVKKILNINAGFDETSAIIQQKIPDSELIVYDFYNEELHTEPSIKRARKAYPPFPNTIQVSTANLLAETAEFDLILNILSAHEIRNDDERIAYFKEQNRILKSNGKIIVTEHLRDLPNFLAYSIGFLHFHSKKTWNETFQNTGFIIEKEIKHTAFISTFILKKNGNTH